MTQIAGVTKQPSLLAMVRTLLSPAPRTAAAGAAATPATARSAASPGTPTSTPRELRRLGSEWRVLDNVPAGRRGRLEYLVIGPGGVFAITARHNARDTICLGAQSLLVGDRRVHHGRISRKDAEDVSARLTESVGYPIPVTALVLIVGDRRFVVPDQHEGAAVRLATPAGGVRWMRRRSTQWTPDGVELIYAAACEPATWGPRIPATP
jgi:hypothetical protein